MCLLYIKENWWKLFKNWYFDFGWQKNICLTCHYFRIWAVVKTHNNFSCLQTKINVSVSTRNWTVSLLGISSPSSEYFSLEWFKRFFFINQIFRPMMYNVWPGSTTGTERDAAAETKISGVISWDTAVFFVKSKI